MNNTQEFNQSSRHEQGQNTARQNSIFNSLQAAHHIHFNSKTMALLYSLQVKMLERSVKTRQDVVYPFERTNEQGRIIEVFEEPALFEVSFFYERFKK